MDDIDMDLFAALDYAEQFEAHLDAEAYGDYDDMED